MIKREVPLQPAELTDRASYLITWTVATYIICIINTIYYSVLFGLALSDALKISNPTTIWIWLPSLTFLFGILASLCPIAGIIKIRPWVFWLFFALMVKEITYNGFKVINDLLGAKSTIHLRALIVHTLAVLVSLCFLLVSIKCYLYIKKIKKFKQSSEPVKLQVPVIGIV